MKSLCAVAAVVVFGAVACHKDAPVDTTQTTSAEALPAADTNGTTAPPAVPGLGKDGASKRAGTAPKANAAPFDDSSAASSVPATDDGKRDNVDAKQVEPAVTTPSTTGTTTVTTTTTTTSVKKPVAKPSEGFGTGAARGNGMSSTGPVGNGGGGVR